jgi:hypothetical protein
VSSQSRLVSLLAPLTAGLLAGRLAGVGSLLPHLPEPDKYAVDMTEFLWEGVDPKAAPLGFYWYPSLIPTVLAAATSDPRPLAEASRSAPLEERLEVSKTPIRRMRILVALTSILAIPGMWLLARRFFGPWEALLPVGWIASSFLFTQFSTQARLHVPEASFALLAIVGALHLRKRPTLGAYALAGVSAALALGCLQNGIFVLPALALSHLLRERPAGRTGWRGPLLAALPILAAVLWFHPFFVEPQDDLRRGRQAWGYASETPEMDRQDYTGVGIQEGYVKVGAQRLPVVQFNGTGFARLAEFLWWNEPFLVVSMLVSLLVLVARGPRLWRELESGRRRDLAIVLVYAVPHLLVLGSYGEIFGRFLLPLFPYFALLASIAPLVLARFARARLTAPAGAAATTAITLLAVGLPSWCAFHRMRLQARPDTVEQAAAWIGSHLVPERDRLLTLTGMTLPLDYDSGSLTEHLRHISGRYSAWIAFQHLFPAAPSVNRPYSITTSWLSRESVQDGGDPDAVAKDFVESFGPGFAVIEMSTRYRDYSLDRPVIDAVHGMGTLVAEFTGRAPGVHDLLWWDYQDAPHAFWRNLRSRNLGPLIRIYRLRGSSD